MTWFTTAEAARRYDRFRPKVHAIAIDWLSPHLPAIPVDRAVDVACGTGDSSLPLLRLAREVVATDASPEMLAHATAKGLTTRLADYTAIPRDGGFDLITTCMAFHWFDPALAIAAFRALSRPGARWLISNFVFAGHASDQRFNDWFKRDYLKRFPSPPRAKMDATAIDHAPGIALLARYQGQLDLHLGIDDLVGYLTTQSNVEAAVRAGRSYEDIEAELRHDIGPLASTPEYRYGYTATVHGIAAP